MRAPKREAAHRRRKATRVGPIGQSATVKTAPSWSLPKARVGRLARQCLLFALGIALATVVFVRVSRDLNEGQIWFRNVDQDSMLLTGALDVASGAAPPANEHPALGAYLLYGGLLRLFHLVGLVPVASMQAFFERKDPLLDLPKIYAAGRLGSAIVALACALLVAAVARGSEANRWRGPTAGFLALSSGGLLFQSLVVRTELTAVFFALLAALCCRVFLTSNALPLLFLGGFFSGVALLSKVQIVAALPLAVWWLSGELRRRTAAVTQERVRAYWIRLGAILSLLSMPVVPALGFAPSLGTIGLWVAWIALGLLSALLLSRYTSRNWRRPVLLVLVFLAGIGCAVRLMCQLSRLDSEAANVATTLALFPAVLLRDYTIANTSLSWLASGFAAYLHYYGTVAFAHAAIVCLSLIACRRVGRRSVALYALGAMFIFVNSVRSGTQPSGINEHHLIFVDIPWAIASALAACEVIDCSRRRWPPTRVLLAGSALCVVVAFSAWSQWRFVAFWYPRFNLGYRNRIDLVARCFYANDGFHRRLLARYGSDMAIAMRIIEDDRLNGRREGIDLRRLPNVRRGLRLLRRRARQLRREERGAPPQEVGREPPP